MELEAPGPTDGATDWLHGATTGWIPGALAHMMRFVLGALVALLIAAVVFTGWWLGRVRPNSRPPSTRDFARNSVDEVPAWLPGDAAYRARVWEQVRAVYRHRGDRPLWIEKGVPSAAAHDFVRVLARAPEDGLDPAAYGEGTIRAALDAPRPRPIGVSEPEAQALATLDVRLTAAFLRYAAEVGQGRIPNTAFDTEWRALRDSVDVLPILEKALDERSATTALAAVARTDSLYVRLRRALNEYRRYAAHGGWRTLREGHALRRGDDEPRVAELRARLARSGDLADSLGGTGFDASLERALRGFQSRHGLPPSGKLDEATRDELNVPAARRVRTLELNLERARWMPPRFPDRTCA